MNLVNNAKISSTKVITLWITNVEVLELKESW